MQRPLRRRSGLFVGRRATAHTASPMRAAPSGINRAGLALRPIRGRVLSGPKAAPALLSLRHKSRAVALDARKARLYLTPLRAGRKLCLDAVRINATSLGRTGPLWVGPRGTAGSRPAPRFLRNPRSTHVRFERRKFSSASPERATAAGLASKLLGKFVRFGNVRR